MTTPERTGRRDDWLVRRAEAWDDGSGAFIVNGWAESPSRRHREWGAELTATDLDFMLVEYERDSARPAALVEFKHMRASMVDRRRSKQLQAVRVLANNSDIPLFLVAYQELPPMFAVWSCNEHAANFLRRDGELMGERDFVDLLYWTRSDRPPERQMDRHLARFASGHAAECAPELLAWRPLDATGGAR